MKYRIIIPGEPKTKKNSPRILKNHRTGKSFVAPSMDYVRYENQCLWILRQCEGRPADPIGYPVNLKCIYYMPTRRRVDLTNLLEATCDILVAAGILEDDNSDIVVSHDGSRVVKGAKGQEHVEIWIETATA